MQEEVARAVADGFTEQEVERAKQHWARQRAAYVGNEALYANRLSNLLQNGRDFGWIAANDARIAQVSAASASAALRTYLGAAPLVWLVAP
jgi:zinc protease